MEIKYIGSVRTRHLLLFHNILLRRVPFTKYIVSGCNWKKTDDGKKAVIRIELEKAPHYFGTLASQKSHKKLNIYKRMRVLDLVWLGWIYLRRKQGVTDE